MSKLLERLREKYVSPYFEPVKEWVSEQGEMGVYSTKDDLGSGTLVYYSIALLTKDGKSWYQQYPHSQLNIILEDAAIIADFAGAKEVGSPQKNFSPTNISPFS